MRVYEQYTTLIRLIESKDIGIRAESGKTLIQLQDDFIFSFEYKGLSSFINLYKPQAKRLSDQRPEIYKKEQYEREMILNDLKFSTHIFMDKYKESIYSRRFVAVNDSCMSFTQVKVEDEYYRWLFVSRSTEVKEMLPADLYTIFNIVWEWTNWFIEYTKTSGAERGIKIKFILNNPHYYV
jgi:hypothetical protein